MGADGTLVPLKDLPPAGAARVAVGQVAPALREPIRPLPHRSQPAHLRLALSLSLTSTSVALSSGVNTILLRLHFPYLSLVHLMLCCTLPLSPLCCLCRTGLMRTSCQRRLVIMLNTGLLLQPCVFDLSCLRLSVGFL
ncbi:hypothetical protein [Bat hepatitis E virus]|uniref:Uncharacterized protein n=1 Tax=Bat hepatitis E virus TaxID=1216472 RepID=I7EKE3_9VIRU|nr:hypothetical protein [Chirohepevirus eptesici]AFP19144.1 hypothetical protein [Bat hepatitis E virus]